jgi:hypothetical protein
MCVTLSFPPESQGRDWGPEGARWWSNPGAEGKLAHPYILGSRSEIA